MIESREHGLVNNHAAYIIIMCGHSFNTVNF